MWIEGEFDGARVSRIHVGAIPNRAEDQAIAQAAQDLGFGYTWFCDDQKIPTA